MSTPLRIGIVAGEASGDILAAGLIRSLKKRYPDAVFEGIGGPKMMALGCKSLFEMEELSVMGLVEVLSRIRRLLHIRKTVIQYFLDNPPDVFIGVDAPDFNLTVEMKLKQAGIKTVHYVSPTVWAWREKRIFKIGKATNLVLSLFPFEKAVYDKHQLPCEFVGHTLADEVPMSPDKKAMRELLRIEKDEKVLALLPGSRGSEVATLIETFVQAAEILNSKIDKFKVLLPVVNQQRHRQIRRFLAEFKPNVKIQLVIGHSREVMMAADAVLLASGTATLEAMLCKRPMVVAYKLKWLTHQLMKWLYKAKFFSLPNLLADRELVPELLNEDANPAHIAELLQPMLTTDQTALTSQFFELHQALKKDADEQAANAVITLLKS